jgi:hypothetical protein
MPPFWVLPLALLFNAAGSALGIYTFISPLAAARMHGIELDSPVDSSPGGPALPFVSIFGDRILAIEVAMFSFYWQRMHGALGTLLLCLIV